MGSTTLICTVRVVKNVDESTRQRIRWQLPTQNRITKNIVIKHLSHLLRSRLDIEKNRICKRDINVKEWKDICKKVEDISIV